MININNMGVGRGGRAGPWPSLDFEIISKKSFFSISRGWNQFNHF